MTFYAVRNQLNYGTKFEINEETERYVEFFFVQKHDDWFKPFDKGRYIETSRKAVECELSHFNIHDDGSLNFNT